MAIDNGIISTTAKSTIFNSSVNTAVTTITLCNDGGVADIVSIYIYNDTNTTETLMLKTLPIPAAETLIFNTEKILLSIDDEIRITKSTTNDLHYTVSFLAI